MGGKQYVLAGSNGGGMAQIFLCARGVARMIVEGVPYEDTGLPMPFKTTEERLARDVEISRASM